VEGHERDDAEEVEATVEVELRGLSLFTHHGVSEAEREIGQRLEIDVTLEVSDCDAVLTDRVEDTVDYAEVTDVVVLAASERSYRTLERVAHVIAERLAESFDCESLRVRVAKPEPPLPVAIGEAAVEVAWHRAPDEDEGGDGEESG
jgi:dihydroneopterin aldolase